MDKLKYNLMKNYEDFDLHESIFNRAINVSKQDGNNSYIDLILGARKYLESYLIKKSINDIDLEILLLDKYKNAMFIVASIYKLDLGVANQIYESSFETIMENYDESKSLYNNLIKVMLKNVKEQIGNNKSNSDEKQLKLFN